MSIVYTVVRKRQSLVGRKIGMRKTERERGEGQGEKDRERESEREGTDIKAICL